jgi:GTP diphosphokinase / guanosine-3',5'-bis(diphosphate) 3'-diphosphatase
MHRFDNLQQNERELCDLITLCYSDHTSHLERAIVFLKQKNSNSKADPLWYQNCIDVALRLAECNIDFEFVLAALFYGPIKQGIISLEECNGALDGLSLGCLQWFLGIANLRDFCIQVLEEGDSNKSEILNVDSQKLAFILAIFLNKIYSIDSIDFSQERETLARDGLEIYSAIAEKGCLHKFKIEIEDISFKILNPEARAVLVEILGTFKQEYESVAKHTIEKLEKRFAGAGIHGKIIWRQKSPYSIWTKMLKKHHSFDKIVDILGLRIILNTIPECYQALGIVHSDYVIVSGFFDDFISVPKPNGYQSIHTAILGPLNHKIEIQIRTRQMHEESEKGMAAHWLYKNQVNQVVFREKKDPTFLVSKDLNRAPSVVCTLADGSTIYLPNGGTVLDVSFKISYKVGISCIGAKVDGEHVSLLHKIKNGSHVEIFTADWHEIDEACQNYVVDPEVKEYIKKYFLDKNWSQKIYSGERTLRNLCNWFKVRSFDNFAADLTKSFGLYSKEELFSNVVQGTIPMNKLILCIDQRYVHGSYILRLTNFLKLMLARLSFPLLREINFSKQKGEIAKCCSPIPGDKVIGCFTISDGLMVHWLGCENLKKLPVHAKIVPVQLESKSDVYKVYLEITFLDKALSLDTISSLISKSDSKIVDIVEENLTSSPAKVVYSVQVCNVQQLHLITSGLKGEKNIYSVKRIRFND